MDVIFEGRLSGEWSMKEVLQAVHDRTGIQSGVLRLASLQSNLSGGVAVTRARLVVGAFITESNESGYAAMRKLLTIREGNFAYLDGGGSDIAQTLHVGIDCLLAAWPNLPENPAELFDEKALFDEVFGGKQNRAPSDFIGAEPVPELPSGAATEPTGRPLGVFKPVSGEPAFSRDERPLLLGASSWLPEAESEGRITFGKLRAHGNKFALRNPMLWPALVVIVLIVLAGLGLLAVNNYNAGKSPVGEALQK